MNILPYKLATTNDQLTSRAGLLAVAELMASLQLAEHVDRHFPQPKSNRGFSPSVYVQAFMLMQHEGSFHLDDVRHLTEDAALRSVLNLDTHPQASSLGAWLRRMGSHKESVIALQEVNKALLKSALHNRKGIPLDIDATEIIAAKSDAQWTYNKNPGYMPMVGHAAKKGQVVACDFREGNAAPAKENLEFIKACQRSLPEGCFVQSLRIDSAGYQTKIIRYCDDQNIGYAIRAKMSAAIKHYIHSLKDEDWTPLVNKQGEASRYQDTCRTVHCMGDYEKAFTLVIQRKRIRGQAELDLDTDTTGEKIISSGYIYRAIATNQEGKSDSHIIHWYNLRGEDSENRIKELKCDVGGGTLPCSDFHANALYFFLSALSYTVFALMRQLLPEELAHHRVMTIRWRLYAMAAKVVKTGRQIWVKLQSKNQALLAQVLAALRGFEPPPI